jgi:hypothetical protein
MNDPTENTFAPPEDAFGEPEAPVRLPAAAARTTIVTLLRFEEFFRRHASAAVHAELRAFCATLGWDPVCGAQALLDDLGLTALPLRWALHATPEQPTRQPANTADINHDKEIA